MVNPAAIMKLMGINEGDVIEITVTKSDGTPVTANMKVQKSDLELLEELKGLGGK